MSDQSNQRYAPGTHPSLPPPTSTTGIQGWLRQNLFSSFWNSALTVLTLVLLVLYIPPSINWLLFDSVVNASSRAECSEIGGGACWAVIIARFDQFIFYQYPDAERWRPVLAFLLLIPALYPLLFDEAKYRTKLFVFSAYYPWIAFVLVYGGMDITSADNWEIFLLGGMQLFAVMLYMDSTQANELKKNRLFLIGFSMLVVAWALLYVLNTVSDWLYAVGLLPELFAQDDMTPAYDTTYEWLSVGVRIVGAGLVIASILMSNPEFLRRVQNSTALKAGFYWASAGILCMLLGWIPDGTLEDGTPKAMLSHVDTSLMGGFVITLLIGVPAILVSLPIGVCLALGRRSHLPIMTTLCTLFIEFIRGVPLITLLFVADTMLNYFLPADIQFDKLLRVQIMVTLFSAAYIAEVVRGGLQAIPKGQYEAADAMGLKYWESMRLVILPQALKISIPGIVSVFIGLYKDTTLVSIIGMLDPLGVGRAVLSDSAWNGLSIEIYVFLAIFYFICCFGMSRYSLYLERKLDTGYGAQERKPKNKKVRDIQAEDAAG